MTAYEVTTGRLAWSSVAVLPNTAGYPFGGASAVAASVQGRVYLTMYNMEEVNGLGTTLTLRVWALGGADGALLGYTDMDQPPGEAADHDDTTLTASLTVSADGHTL